MEAERIAAHLKERWGSICWSCGGKGYWMEQIDGPDNLRKVMCDNPKHALPAPPSQENK